MILKTGKFDGKSATMSINGTLVILDGRFAVESGSYNLKPCPYLRKISSGRHTVELRTKTNTAVYDIFEKTTKELPNTCIESAEHLIKSMHANHHATAPYENGNGAEVVMSIHTAPVANIDKVSMITWAKKAFPTGPRRGTVDASRDKFESGEGMALVYSSPEERKDAEWTVHAVGVLMNSTKATDRFLVVSEVFAPDLEDDPDVDMSSDWHVRFFRDAADFKAHYSSVMPASKYTLWKIATAKESRKPAVKKASPTVAQQSTAGVRTVSAANASRAGPSTPGRTQSSATPTRTPSSTVPSRVPRTTASVVPSHRVLRSMVKPKPSSE